MRDLNTIKSCSEVYRKVFCPISELSKKNLSKIVVYFTLFFPSVPGIFRPSLSHGKMSKSRPSPFRGKILSSKTGKKCIFCVFRPCLSLCCTASRPYMQLVLLSFCPGTIKGLLSSCPFVLGQFCPFVPRDKEITPRQKPLHVVHKMACHNIIHNSFSNQFSCNVIEVPKVE